MDLDQIKRDKNRLLEALGVQRQGNHLRCPWHEDTVGSMQVNEGDDGTWFWKCHAGCGGGTIVDAYALANRCSPAEACKRLTQEEYKSERSGSGPVVVRQGVVTQAKDRSTKWIKATMEAVDNGQAEAARAKRGISYDVLRKYSVGWCEKLSFAGRSDDKITGWSLPITDANGNLLGIKLHREVRSERQSKCGWCPFGEAAAPGERVKHGVATLWPAPESFTDDYIIICPGELKALYAISLGFPATSPTAGEGTGLGDLVKRIEQSTVILLPDCEPDKVRPDGTTQNTGKAWANRVSMELAAAGKMVEVGRLADEYEIFAEISDPVENFDADQSEVGDRNTADAGGDEALGCCDSDGRGGGESHPEKQVREMREMEHGAHTF